jgi:polyhydroxyalkanoate synthase
MVWNADGTRMPFAMHSEYLRKLFLRNDLAEGRFVAGGQPISLSALKAPMFVVGTQTDHVAPWRSVHKIHMLTDAEICFALTNGGHNAGIVSEPGHKHRHYQMLVRPACAPALAPDVWQAQARTIPVRGGRRGANGLMQGPAPPLPHRRWARRTRVMPPSPMRRAYILEK